MSTIRDEQDAIRNLARDITNLSAGLDIHYNDCGDAVTGVSVFKVNPIEVSNDLLWMHTVYDWEQDKAHLPQLRMLRHRLEELYQEALAERRELVA